MLMKRCPTVGAKRMSSLLIQSLALSIVVCGMLIDAPRAEGQLLRRLRSRLATPPLPPGVQPPLSRVPQFRNQRDGRQQPSPTPLNPANPADSSERNPEQGTTKADPKAAGESILQSDNAESSASPRPTIGIQARNRAAGPAGVEVLEFRQHSKADDAGLRVGDLIFAIDGRPTPSIESMTKQLIGRKPGETVRLRIQRGRQIGELDVPLVAYPNNRAGIARNPEPSRSLGGKLGVEIENAEGTRGATVISVQPNSAAQRAGLKVGDRIVSVDGQLVADTPGLIREVASRAPGSSIAVQLVRNDRLLNSRVTLTDGAEPTDTPAVSAAEGPTENLATNSGASILEGVGSTLGGLLNGSGTSEESLPPPRELSAKTAVPASARTNSRTADADQKAATAKDVLAFGDDEPIDSTILEAFGTDVAEDKASLADPPSLEPPGQLKSKSDRIAELKAEIKRLQEEIRELEDEQ